MQAGTLAAGLTAAGLTVVFPAEDDQERLHEAIYHPRWGLKAISRVTERAHETLDAVLTSVASQRRVDAFLLGCTELSFGIEKPTHRGVPIFDALNLLAREMIHEVDPQKLEPLAEGVEDRCEPPSEPPESPVGGPINMSRSPSGLKLEDCDVLEDCFKL